VIMKTAMTLHIYIYIYVFEDNELSFLT